MSGALYLVIAFACGALPFALWIGRRVRGIDLRDHGSGNLGATNVLRNLGPGWGLLTLLLDMGKGWIAVASLPAWMGLSGVAEGALWPVLGAVAAVLGHCLTPLAGFRGGKGVATSLGAFIGLAPFAALLGIVGFVLTVWISRFVSLGSMVMSLIFPLAAILWGPPAPLGRYVIGVGILLALLVAWRHRANWGRIAKGSESRFQWRSR